MQKLYKYRGDIEKRINPTCSFLPEKPLFLLYTYPVSKQPAAQD